MYKYILQFVYFSLILSIIILMDLDFYNNIIVSLRVNVNKLKEQNSHLKEEISLLNEELMRKQHELMLAHKDIIEVQAKYDNVIVAKSLLSNTSEEKEVIEDKISKLVREINKCIALINQQ